MLKINSFIIFFLVHHPADPGGIDCPKGASRQTPRVAATARESPDAIWFGGGAAF